MTALSCAPNSGPRVSLPIWDFIEQCYLDTRTRLEPSEVWEHQPHEVRPGSLDGPARPRGV